MKPDRQIPYPAVFRDWQHGETRRVAVHQDRAGVGVQMLIAEHTWMEVVLTEDDACLLAARLLRLAGQGKLSKRVLNR